MNDCKWRPFEGGLRLNCVRWYCRYGRSYRDLKNDVGARYGDGSYNDIVLSDPTCTGDEKVAALLLQTGMGYSWQVDET